MISLHSFLLTNSVLYAKNSRFIRSSSSILTEKSIKESFLFKESLNICKKSSMLLIFRSLLLHSFAIFPYFVPPYYQCSRRSKTKHTMRVDAAWQYVVSMRVAYLIMEAKCSLLMWASLLIDIQSL